MSEVDEYTRWFKPTYKDMGFPVRVLNVLKENKRVVGFYMEQYLDRIGMVAFVLTEKKHIRVVGRTLLGLRQYYLGTFQDDEALILSRLIRKAGTGRVAVYCKAADTASSVAKSHNASFAQDAQGPISTENNKIAVISSTKLKRIDDQHACDKFQDGKRRILVTSVKMMQEYEILNIALFVIYTEGGLEGSDLKDYRERWSIDRGKRLDC
ncbi:hypothetical protein BGW39_001394, partial [Mortierella sp. 14UC]